MDSNRPLKFTPGSRSTRSRDTLSWQRCNFRKRQTPLLRIPPTRLSIHGWSKTLAGWIETCFITVSCVHRPRINDILVSLFVVLDGCASFAAWEADRKCFCQVFEWTREVCCLVCFPWKNYAIFWQIMFSDIPFHCVIRKFWINDQIEYILNLYYMLRIYNLLYIMIFVLY